MGVEQQRVAGILLITVFISLFLLINSREFTRAGIVFTALGVFAWFVYSRGRVI